MLILIAALCMNSLGCFLAVVMHLPLYLDSLLTMGVTAICGLIPGLVCAILSNLLLSFCGYTMIPFTICHIFTALFAWLTFRIYKKDDEVSLPFEAFLWAGLWSGISNGILGNFIAESLYSSYTGVPKVDFMVKGIYIALGNLNLATYITGIIENLCDKAVSAVLSYLMYKILYKINTDRYR
ncbi:MAG: hypothetical protein K5873_05845 [Treponema sp.]|nr:hypothetical protein [Treponema sp.]